jgi:hypothetical protein
MTAERSTYKYTVQVLSIVLCACVLVPSLAAGAESHSAATTPAAVTSGAALQRLVEGNQRFVAGKPTREDQSTAYRHGLTSSRTPSPRSPVAATRGSRSGCSIRASAIYLSTASLATSPARTSLGSISMWSITRTLR